MKKAYIGYSRVEVILMRYQRKREEEKGQSLISKVVSIGFFGGLIWSVVASVAAYFHFTSVSPKSFILRSWLQIEWTDQWLGQLISILVVSLLSIGIAFLYYFILKKIRGIWIGIGFGVVLWFILFWLFEPIFPNIPTIFNMDSDTIVTTVCLFILYGVFIGYSISFSYQQYKDEN
ncbi:YqhR family membrane protein [Gracilibacillus sp. JCM 18860]|uniref:YqhR family membrane protein n=1 Tax=Gracilibacillus sp. JCM 18860 TaxID=1306159 RepID=UPI003261050A